MHATSQFEGDVAVVTGGAGGIGRGLVESLLAAGARVAALDVGEATASEVRAVKCDVTDPASVQAAIGGVTAEEGPIKLLVCAAGIDSRSPLVDLDPAEWHRVVNVSLTGAFLTARAVVPSMVRGGGGSIVAFSSGWATKGCPNGAHYAAAKAGVEAMVKSLALEVARLGIRVNAVAPGPVRTPMVEIVSDLAAWEQERSEAIPMGRIGEVEDIVGPVLFLLGEQSRYITGQVLHVNGGLLMP